MGARARLSESCIVLSHGACDATVMLKGNSMRRFLLTASILLIALDALAVAPQFWRVRTPEDFLAGEIEGFAITSRGELKVAPAARKVASFTDPFVLSQTVAPNGDRFFGTGNDGKVYRLKGEELKVLFTASEPEIYAMAFRDGAIYAGSSPNGKIYRINPDTGAHSVFFDPEQAYIWAIAALGNGDLAVATGVEGKLFKVTPKGEGKVLYDSSDTHLRSLAVRRDGTILAGAAGRGRIYQISPSGSAHALFDSPLNEITAIYVDGDGIAYAAAVSNILPSTAPARTARAGQQQQQQQQQQQSSEAKKEETASAVEVTFSFEDPAAVAAQAGSSELYRIHTDGYVETVRKFEREMVYTLAAGSGGVLLGTGPTGRIYELQGNELSLVGSVPEKQVVSISGSPSGPVVTTTNAGAVYRLDGRATKTPEYRSAAKDVERFSRFGNYRIEGRDLSNASFNIAFRSGNTRTPDQTWSDWSATSPALEGNIQAPAGRYLQWKIEPQKASPAGVIETVTVTFVNRNIAPQIEGLVVHDPAVIFLSASYPAAPQVVEATNPDEHGIFTSLDTPRDRIGSDQGKRAFRKGYRTVSWRAQDENGDPLRYSLWFRMKGTGPWLRLRENMEETQLNFDTSQLPDGRYELRLVASDALTNPEMPLTAEKEGVEFEIDNTPPAIAVTTSGDEIVVRVTDRMSPVVRVEFSADAERWNRMTPVDGIADSRDETFRLKRSELKGKFIVIRAVDAFYNVATEAVNAR
jgi:outer membrane protein assembly factor BamB